MHIQCPAKSQDMLARAGLQHRVDAFRRWRYPPAFQHPSQLAAGLHRGAQAFRIIISLLELH